MIAESPMVVRDNQRTNLPHPLKRAVRPARFSGLSGLLGAGFATLLFCACIPSFPPCDCSKADDESGDGPSDFPDFDFLDRTVACADIPLPIEGAECGYPEGPYGFEVDSVFENLELFDCTGAPVQIAQYLPQVGLPDVQAHGVVFGVGAAWCAPCAEEAKEWAANFVDQYPTIQFVQALDEGAVGSATMESCAGWSAANAEDKFPILFTPDQGALQAKISAQSGAPIPYTLLFDANANVIFKSTGGVVDSGILTIQLDKLINDPYGDS